MTDVPGSWQGVHDRGDLHENNVPPDPLTLFAAWFASARTAAIIEPAAMTLATIDTDGWPSARTVLLRGHDAAGFRFYSNYDSRKGQALAAHPVAALVFWWEQLERQIRITGHVEKLAATHSDAYFQKRPRGSRIGAHASPQSQVIANRCELEQRMAAAEKSFASHSIPRPSHWGGYLLRPAMIEFWQARRNRLHDRLRYTRRADRWILERLAP